MGRLVDGKWTKTSIITSDKNGAYDRIPRSFRETISANHKVFKPESGRYHLYVAGACPWAHRTLIYRSLKGLESHISIDVVHPDMLEMGWTFATDFKGTTGDSLFEREYLYEIYQKAQEDISTSVTVPILWDKQTNRIVNNESSEIIRIFNSEFNTLTHNHDDFYPVDLRPQIDSWNDRIYPNINNGVYRCGFAKTQEAYNEAAIKLFDTLEEIESHLSDNEYLAGNQLTEADLRLVPTLLRFDLVYFTHFKTNYKRIADYPNLSAYTYKMFHIEAVKKTTWLDQIKRHYYYSHESINPCRIVPIGPTMDLFKKE